MTITDETVLDCGHKPSPHSQYTTGYGTDREGKTSCYDCANSQEAAAFSASDRYTAYVNKDGYLTTWPGGVLAQAMPRYHGVSRNGWHGSEVHSWRFRDCDGAEWYGRNGGPGMVITVRRAKHKG
jgi:hypothetical protein